jgi:hypothetical protein
MSREFMLDFGPREVSDWKKIIYPLLERYTNKMCIFYDLESLFYDLAKDVKLYEGEEKELLLSFLRFLSNILIEYYRKEREVKGEKKFFCFEPEESYINYKR